MKTLFFILLGISAFSCAKKDSIEQPASEFEPGVKLAEIKDDKLEEISGLAASINNAPLLWGHNDSGNKAEIYLLDKNLDIRLTCELKGVENRDWEDITVGPGPDSSKNYVYIGEIGDNDAQYKYKYVYRFEEPTWKEHQQKKIVITEFDKITFQLSDEQKDTEALILDPKTKNLYIISKREEPVYLYELKYPYSSNDTVTALKLISLPFTKIVGADLSADGRELLMKNYSHVFYWNSSIAKPLNDLLKDPPKSVPYEIEPQGESITWATDGSGFYTLSEVNKNKKSYLYFYKRR
ncbi:hypothetical protein [Chryseolinea sp. H1M3-3]|uniref:hypothetical protein n=1 Tax=Chryseolinea sp. H1M3-3 TaxID=3034144 RepID=UPI0023ECC117|nr:hypothetical protein [Chryseolinea sp. H1M3-3]